MRTILLILIAPFLAFLFCAPTNADEKQTSIGEIPLCDLGTGTFQGFTGGLYPNGSNIRPPDHEAAGLRIARNEVQPLNASGQASPGGKIVMISLGVSHTSMVFDRDGPNSFKPRADADPTRNPQLVIVDGASDGHNTAQWLGNMPLWDGLDPWKILDQRLQASGVTPSQVQVAWMMSIGGFDPKEPVSFPQSAKNRQAGIEALVLRLKGRFPNLKLAYTSQRPYSYSDPVKGLAPEPVNYHSGFGDKWMIENQIKGAGNLNFDPAKGEVVAPWLSWGPYQWADGIHPRSDGLAWLPSDFLAYSYGQIDWAHPSHAGVRKESDQLLAFFKTDPTATPWFLRKTSNPPELAAVASSLSGKAPVKVRFSARAKSPQGITDILWTFDDGCYSISPNPLKIFHVPGVYQVRVTASDRAGNTATRTLVITVKGTSSLPAKARHYPPVLGPPSGHNGPFIRISSPEDGAKIADPTNIVIKAEALSRDRTVTTVDFFKGGTSKQDSHWRVWLGNASAPPYQVTWRWDPQYEYDPAGGQFALTAKATDNFGAVTESTINVTVTSSKAVR